VSISILVTVSSVPLDMNTVHVYARQLLGILDSPRGSLPACISIPRLLTQLRQPFLSPNRQRCSFFVANQSGDAPLYTVTVEQLTYSQQSTIHRAY